MGKAKWGDCEWGYFRWSVYGSQFRNLLNQMGGVATCTATRRRLSLGARDSTTNWRAKSFTESTVTGVFITRGVSPMALPSGTYVRLDAVFITQDGFQEGDEFKTDENEYYEVKAVEDAWLGTDFSHRTVHLAKLPLHT